MKSQNWFLQDLEKIQETVEYRLEKILIEVAEDIAIFMKEENINRAQLAKRLGVSRAHVTKILNGNPNLTIRSLVKIGDVFEKDLQISFPPKYQIAAVSAHQTIPQQNQDIEKLEFKLQKKESRGEINTNDSAIAA